MANLDVRRLTTAVMLLASQKLDLNKKLDNDMFNHITYVANRILMIAKKDGLNKKSLEVMGKYIWRLLRVLQAYNHKTRDVSLGEIISIVTEFKSVFVGA